MTTKWLSSSRRPACWGVRRTKSVAVAKLREAIVAVTWCVLLGTSTSAAHAETAIVAHRGASADAPENTIRGFEMAWECGADAIEGDFHLTQDGQIVCIHDDTTERVAIANLQISESTLGELRRLDVGSWKAPRFAGLHIPTLTEVLDCVPSTKLAYLEIKCGPEVISALTEDLRRSRTKPSQAVVISFNPDVIKAAKAAMPERQALWLVRFQRAKGTNEWTPTRDEVIQTAQCIGADGLDVAGVAEVVTGDFIAACRRAGFSVHVWTIDDVPTAKLFRQLGVDSITTNRPRELREALYPEVPTRAYSDEAASVLSEAPPAAAR